jgi:hypothetical protein
MKFTLRAWILKANSKCIKNRHVALAECFKGRKFFSSDRENICDTPLYWISIFSLTLCLLTQNFHSLTAHNANVLYNELDEFWYYVRMFKIFYTVYCLSLGFNGIRFFVLFALRILYLYIFLVDIPRALSLAL